MRSTEEAVSQTRLHGAESKPEGAWVRVRAMRPILTHALRTVRSSIILYVN